MNRCEPWFALAKSGRAIFFGALAASNDYGTSDLQFVIPDLSGSIFDSWAPAYLFCRIIGHVRILDMKPGTGRPQNKISEEIER